MNSGSYQLANWVAGIALFLALVLAVRPTAAQMRVAAVLWCIGALGVHARFFGNIVKLIASAFITSPPSEITPLSLVFDIPSAGVAFTGVALLHPAVEREHALLIARGILLSIGIVYISLVIVTWSITLPVEFQKHIKPFAAPGAWIFYSLLWLRIRNKVKYNDESETEQSA